EEDAARSAESFAERAKAALDEGDLVSAELFAATALRDGEQPLARGVLVEAESRARAKPKWRARFPSACARLEIRPEGEEVACATVGGVALLDLDSGQESGR